ncbi:ribosomal protein S18-alanine N-acetyltransferase [Umboniibacter marinipuniceus]|uniref:[SSU ribosomal protein S18P]-alanine acetyltransferase n=1 Tax=Umboniibacter marinipuniceus TaxID=569599 RepID=A0A3M0A2X7_9GAMM|nr:ribosomal protein S18-alanine N-acetyltransferase [Umboniibacter marinipuniceus]RMA79521.1 [SSU ribosomal protein S18P]-alanine acetyltransferase [Umboniibacter marinipuniceus]
MDSSALEGYKFTVLHESHFEAVKGLEQGSHSHPWSNANILSALCSTRTQVLGFLDPQSELAAYAVFDSVLDEITLQNIAVDLGHRRKGLAYKLIESAWSIFPNTTTQFLEVRESNTSAISLYEKLGFVEVGVRNNYYPCDRKGREDAIIMALTRLDD